ncbi:hypothetical protein F4861DRAFT_544388 [Xylaria intraflava]|nr:hypothetical protein F4861DRAFT_544388 [Xylaria intraflava]
MPPFNEMFSYASFTAQFAFNEERGWHALDREVVITDEDGNETQETVVARPPCADCVTRCHLDVRVRCLCADPEGIRCVVCDKDHHGCRAIPEHLLGSAQIITSFSVRMCRLNIRLFNRINDAEEDAPFPRVTQTVKDVERFARIETELTSIRRLLSLKLDRDQHREVDNPMTDEEFCRRLNDAQPLGERHDDILSRLGHWLLIILNHDFTTPLPSGEINWLRSYNRGSAEQYFLLDRPYWDGPGEDLILRSRANAPAVLVPITPRKVVRRARSGGDGGGEEEDEGGVDDTAMLDAAEAAMDGI